MKKLIPPCKTAILCFILTFIITLTACGNEPMTRSSTFPSIDDTDIPDVLEFTVGTLGDCYYSSGITDNPDYSSILSVTFNGTTETDYHTLIEHYQSASTGIEENGSMLFDWGTLQVTTDDESILINAFIK